MLAKHVDGLIEALYSSKKEVAVEASVMLEDGRSSTFSADLGIHDVAITKA